MLDGVKLGRGYEGVDEVVLEFPAGRDRRREGVEDAQPVVLDEEEGRDGNMWVGEQPLGERELYTRDGEAERIWRGPGRLDLG